MTGPSLVLLVLIAPSLSVVVSEETFPAVEDTKLCKNDTQFENSYFVTCEIKSPEDIKRIIPYTHHTGFIHILRLRYCNLTEIPGDMFNGLKVISLLLLNNNLSSVHKNAFAPLASSMEDLSLEQNQLTEIPVEALRPLDNLRWFSIVYEKIEEIPSHAFSGLHWLKFLTLSNNKISTIDENAFKGIRFTLTKLYLGNNNLTSVPVKALHNLTRLRHLDLGDNRISKISERDFQDLSALEYLNLSYNLIENLPSQLFNKHMVLKHLNLEGNMIETISNDAFIEVADTLEWLFLGGNRLFNIPVGGLRPLHRVTELDLSQNNIAILPENAFDSFSRNLLSLLLNKNR